MKYLFTRLMSATIAGMVLSAFAGDADAAQKVVIKKNRAQVLNFWTPARLLSAQPRWQTAPKPADLQAPNLADIKPFKSSYRRSGAKPTKDIKGKLRRDLIPQVMLQQKRQQSAGKAKPQAQGSSGALYSQSAIFPPELAQAYPLSAAGKFFFTDPTTGGQFICSASLIAPRLMITAAHCIFDNVNQVVFTDFLFAPGYFNGTAPLGAWTPVAGLIPQSWIDSAALPHPEDFGVLVLGDLSADGQAVRAGDIAGIYGIIGSDITTHLFHVDFLGYPGNLDGGEIMQRTGAQTAATFEPNNALYGSDQQGGSSGGPYVIDLQFPAAGGIDRFPSVVAVESFGDGSGNVGVSLLNGTAGAMLEALCGQAAGNC